MGGGEDKEVLSLCLGALTFLEAPVAISNVFSSRFILGFSRPKQTFEIPPFLKQSWNLTPPSTPPSFEVTWVLEQISCLLGCLGPGAVVQGAARGLECGAWLFPTHDPHSGCVSPDKGEHRVCQKHGESSTFLPAVLNYCKNPWI